MGGMIAIKMAEILESEGEKVFGVVLIDSTSPEGHPAFNDAHERDEVAEWTYKASAGQWATWSRRYGLWRRCCPEQRRNKDSGLGDEDDDEVDVMEYLRRMRERIYNSLGMIARAGEGNYLPKEVKSPMTLVKCTQLATLPNAMPKERKNAIRHRFQDERAGWTTGTFHSILLDARHDDVFDNQHIGQVTDILSVFLEGMK